MEPKKEDISPTSLRSVIERGIYLNWIAYAGASIILTLAPIESSIMGYIGQVLMHMKDPTASLALDAGEIHWAYMSASLSLVGGLNWLLARRLRVYGMKHLRFELHENGLQESFVVEDEYWHLDQESEKQMRELKILLEAVAKADGGMKRQIARNDVSQWIGRQPNVHHAIMRHIMEETPYLIPSEMLLKFLKAEKEKASKES